MDKIFAALDTAHNALKTAQGLYNQFKEVKGVISEDDQAKLKQKLAELQVESDRLHNEAQAKLRG